VAPPSEQPDAFDPDALRLNSEALDGLGKRSPKRLPRHRPGDPFLKGPVPWRWLTTAAGLPGKALQVGLFLWKEAGCRKSGCVAFCLAHGAEVGVTRKAGRHALRRLEAAGLVRVEHRPGRALQVTLLDPSERALALPPAAPDPAKGDTGG
jgi:hypothetical protein